MNPVQKTLFDFIDQDLLELKDKNLFRVLKTLDPISSTRAYFQGKDLTLFCSNDYLGLSHHPRVVAVAKKTIDTWGVGAGAARLISGTTDWHTRLETKIAQFKGKEKALVFTAGYLANLGVLTALAGEKDLIVMDKLCHASIIDGARLSGAEIRVFPHKNYERLEEIIQVEARRLKVEGGRSKILVVTDGVFSMDGDLADLEALIRIKKNYGALLVVDDAHGTGVLGLNGRGIGEDEGLDKEIDVVVGTLSKAIGCLGGFAVGSEKIINYLINHARPFIFATALPPSIAAAAYEAISVIETEPQVRHMLWKNIQMMHKGLTDLGFEQAAIRSPIFPLMIGDEKEALQISDRLLKLGFLVPAIRTPTVAKGKARLRVTVSAAHSENDISKILSALKS